MESPVVVDKPPEYHGNSDRGFPFDEEEGSGAWSELAARHPDIAARLRQRPATWARKRRPSSQDATDDFGESFTGFDRFPFDDIPPEFREHFPSHWNRRYSDREQAPEGDTAHAQPPPPQQHTAATQTERAPPAAEPSLPQYGLRNTVDLGQRSAADPSVDAEERGQRSMSAPPDAPRAPDMSSNQHEAHAPSQEHHSNVRHIPIFVEGRDEPVINRNVDHGTHFGESKSAHQSPPAPQPHIDRDAYFAEDGPVSFHHPPNFTRAFGTPFNKGFRQGPQPFVQQKAYPQNAFARGASPQRAQSPLRAQSPMRDEHFVKVPVQHEQAPRPSTARAQHEPARAQQKPAPARQPSPQRSAPAPAPAAAAREPTPPPRQPSPNDPITQILSIQTDVLNLMTEVENFAGTKKDKRYLFLDEMLTRNLIKLDNIETEGKENIRQARKEAIKCIQKCIAVLEAKAESNATAAAQPQPQTQPQDVVMKEQPAEDARAPETEPAATNGEVEMKEAPKAEENAESQPERIDEPQPSTEQVKEEAKRESTPKAEEQTQKVETQAGAAPPTDTQPAADTRPAEPSADEQKTQVDNKPNPKKKVVKKRDKSKEAAKESPSAATTEAPKDSNTEEASKDSNKTEVAQDKVEVMQVDDKGEKAMEVDGAASQ